MPKTITGGMPDTMEYFTVFHIELQHNGYQAMLAAMLMVIVMMVAMLIEYDRIMQIIEECVVRRSN